jgi:hypothetical protein
MQLHKMKTTATFAFQLLHIKTISERQLDYSVQTLQLNSCSSLSSIQMVVVSGPGQLLKIEYGERALVYKMHNKS